MAWNAVTDVNDGQDFGGSAWQSAIDAVTQLQGVLGTDEVDAAKLRASMRGVCFVTASQVFDSGVLAAFNPWDTTVLNPSTFTVSGAGVIPNVAGWYLVLGRTALSSLATTIARRLTLVTKNGSQVGLSSDEATGTASSRHGHSVWAFVQCNGTTDGIGLSSIQTDSGAAQRTIDAEMLVISVLPT